ncbi:hypothetical protein C2E23DRAFT_857183 [Lenzites betulinus]|nr:hypothetical protein C2E23DRAFT_857183 [Lenzites betulinus]
MWKLQLDASRGTYPYWDKRIVLSRQCERARAFHVSHAAPLHGRVHRTSQKQQQWTSRPGETSTRTLDGLVTAYTHGVGVRRDACHDTGGRTTPFLGQSSGDSEPERWQKFVMCEHEIIGDYYRGCKIETEKRRVQNLFQTKHPDCE